MPNYTTVGGYPNPDPYGEDDEPECGCCGGEGFVELEDHPELWEDDCLMEMNRLVTCPECGGLPDGAPDNAPEGRIP
jgi:hypothetical protein